MLVVDQPSSLVQTEIQEYAQANGMELLPIPPGAKDKNAMAERAIRTFRDMLSKMTQGQKWTIWEECVPLIEKNMRETPSIDTGVSPFESLYRFPP